jgi:hypothetical protein
VAKALRLAGTTRNSSNGDMDCVLGDWNKPTIKLTKAMIKNTTVLITINLDSRLFCLKKDL